MDDYQTVMSSDVNAVEVVEQTSPEPDQVQADVAAKQAEADEDFNYAVDRVYEALEGRYVVDGKVVNLNSLPASEIDRLLMLLERYEEVRTPGLEAMSVGDVSAKVKVIAKVYSAFDKSLWTTGALKQTSSPTSDVGAKFTKSQYDNTENFIISNVTQSNVNPFDGTPLYEGEFVIEGVPQRTLLKKSSQTSTPTLAQKGKVRVIEGTAQAAEGVQKGAEGDVTTTSSDFLTPKAEEIDTVFTETSELSSIGSKEEYTSYVASLFPDSQIRRIVYRGASIEHEKGKANAHWTFNVGVAQNFTTQGSGRKVLWQ
jgi:hypothetical protein